MTAEPNIDTEDKITLFVIIFVNILFWWLR